MPSWEVKELPTGLVMLQGPETHLHARFSGRGIFADWKKDAAVSRTPDRRIACTRLTRVSSTRDMTFSGPQRVESGVLAHALDVIMERSTSTPNTRFPRIQYLEEHQASPERQTSPNFILVS